MTEHQEAVISARPRVRIADEIRSDINTALLDMQVRLPLSGMASAEIRMVNWRANDADGGAGFPFQEIEMGERLELLSGEQRDEVIFDGEITAIEERYGNGAPQLVLLAEDKLHRLAKIRHSRVFEEMSVADVIGQIASEVSLQANAEVGDAQESWHQLNESNLAFLMRLLSPYDIALRIQNGELRARPEEEDSTPEVLHPQNNVRHLRIIADLNRQPTEVKVVGFNPAANDEVAAEEDALTPSPAGQSAAALLNDLGWEATAYAPHPFARTQAEAQGWAEGRFRHRAKRFLHGEILCSGVPSLRSGREVELNGVSSRLQGRYQVVDCHHHFDNGEGYTTRIKVQRSDWGG